MEFSHSKLTYNCQIVALADMISHTISFEQLMPVLLSMSESHDQPALPFKFTGGFGLSTKTIGLILSMQGVYQMAVQMFLFPTIVRRFGSLKTFRFTALAYPFLYFLVPYLALLPDHFRLPGLAIILVWKVTFQSLAYPSNMLLLTNAAPSLLVLGAINGVAASAASLSRAFGPTVSGIIQSVGLNIGYSGVPWWANAAVCIVGSVQCLWMTETNGRFDVTDDGAEKLEAPNAGIDSKLPEIRLSSASDTTLVDEGHEGLLLLRKSNS